LGWRLTGVRSTLPESRRASKKKFEERRNAERFNNAQLYAMYKDYHHVRGTAAAMKVHLGNIQGTFNEHSGNIQRTFREHSA
jgi:hypothetical protein